MAGAGAAAAAGLALAACGTDGASTSSFAGGTGVAEGVPATVTLTVLDLHGTEVTPLTGAALCLWHCDRDGNYPSTCPSDRWLGEWVDALRPAPR